MVQLNMFSPGISCLGGGVFLATCFLHLIPEATQQLQAALGSTDDHLQIPFAVVIGGFLLVLLSEEIIHMFHKGGHGHSHGGPSTDELGPTPVPNYGAIHRDEAIGQISSPEHEDENLGNTLDDSDDEDRMTTVSMHGDPGSHSAFRAIVLVFALSLHSIFEGIAIGLQKDQQNILQLFAAIMVHKCVIAITLGTNLVNSTTRLKSWAIFTCIGVFSAMAPLGIVIAIALNDFSSPMLNGVLQCIAAGTFVYITFFEVLPHELNSKHTHGSRLYKIFMLLLGIAIIMVMNVVLPDDDSHPHPTKNSTSHIE